jgi:addiction module RelE/StbE family toxin
VTVVNWSDFALDDLDEIRHYISKDSPYYAREFIEKIFDTTDRLSLYPLSGRLVPEADDEVTREIIVQGYRVMYSVEPECVLVLAVMHGSRNLLNPDNQPWNKKES